MSEIQKKDKKCGDFGGWSITQSKPCGKPAGQGTPEKAGKCSQHRDEPSILTEEGLEQVKKLASYGMNQDQIADWFGYKRSWFRKVKQANPIVERKWRKGKSELLATTFQNLIKKANEDDSTKALIEVVKRIGGPQWGENDEVVHKHEGNQQAVQVNIGEELKEQVDNLDGSTISQARKQLTSGE